MNEGRPNLVDEAVQKVFDEIAEFQRNLRSNQVPLGVEFEAVWNRHREELYEN